MSKLTKNAKWIFGANVTNSFQAYCTVPDNATPLSFKNQNAHNQSFKLRHCDAMYHGKFLRKLKKSTKYGSQKSRKLKRSTFALDIHLAFFVNFDTLVPLGVLEGF